MLSIFKLFPSLPGFLLPVPPDPAHLVVYLAIEFPPFLPQDPFLCITINDLSLVKPPFAPPPFAPPPAPFPRSFCLLSLLLLNRTPPP